MTGGTDVWYGRVIWGVRWTAFHIISVTSAAGGGQVAAIAGRYCRLYFVVNGRLVVYNLCRQQWVFVQKGKYPAKRCKCFSGHRIVNRGVLFYKAEQLPQLLVRNLTEVL